MTQQLSPITQKVYDAFWRHLDGRPLAQDCPVTDRLAATLRAIADIVAPVDYEDIWTDGRILQYEKQDPIRDKLLSIANELESIQ